MSTEPAGQGSTDDGEGHAPGRGTPGGRPDPGQGPPPPSGYQAPGHHTPGYQAPGHQTPGHEPPPPGWGHTPTGDWAPPTGPGGPAPGWHPPGHPPRAPKPGVVPLRPLAFGEILDGAFTTIQRYPAIMLGLSAAVFTVLSLVQFTLGRALGVDQLMASLEQQPATVPPDQVLDGLAGLGTFAAASVLLQWVIGTALTGVITVAAARGVLGEPVSIRTAWRASRRRLPRLLVLTLLLGLVVGGILAVYVGLVFLAFQANAAVALVVMLLGIGATIWLMLFLLIRWAVAACAVVLETRVSSDPGGPARTSIGVLEAMRRSWHLIKGRSWRTFGIVIVAALIAAVVAGILQYAFVLLASGISSLVGDSGSALVGGIGTVSAGVLQMAFVAAVNVLVYADARMRSEGLDIELTAASTRHSASVSTGVANPGGGVTYGDPETAEASDAPWTVT